MSPNPQETADLVTQTKEILNVKLHSLCSAFVFRESDTPDKQFGEATSISSSRKIEKWKSGSTKNRQF